MKFINFTYHLILGMTLSAALAGCRGSQEANAPTGPGPSTPAPATTGPSTPAPATTGPAPADAGLPKITEKPAEPTPTPKEATRKGGAEKGEVKKEEPPKGA